MTTSDKAVAVVTGAGRGIGAATAKRLAKDGFHVIAADRDASGVTELGAAHPEFTIEPAVVDVTDRQAVLSLFAELDERVGRVDAVVNNAMWIDYQPITETSEDTLDGMFAIGLKAAFWTMQGAVPIMERTGGVIINMSSPAATRGVKGSAAYSAIKGAVSSLTWQASREFGPRGIRVNGVIPGAVPTPGARKVVDDEGYEIRRQMNSLGKLATPEDVAGAISYLASPDASFVTGHLLAVDGGL